MIRVDPAPYVGKPVSELVEAETTKKMYGELFSQGFYLTRNGEVLEKEALAETKIEEGDEIELVPLFAGG